MLGASVTPPLFFVLAKLFSADDAVVHDDDSFLVNALYSLGPTATLTLLSTLTINYLNRTLPWKTKALKRLLVEIFVIGAYTVSVAFAFVYVYDCTINHDADYSIILVNNLIFCTGITFLVVTIIEASFFFSEWKKALVAHEQIEKEHYKSQFQNLKNQLNPHVLFNSLNALTALVETDKTRAVDYIQSLSKYLRLTLSKTDDELITLEQELQLVRHYFELQHERFGSNLQIDYDSIMDYKDWFVVPLSLQILVENAVKHNVVSSKHPLQIEFATEGDYLVVKNRIQLKTQIAPSSQTGLKNIQERYTLLNAPPVHVEETDDWFIVKIPMLTLHTS